MGKKNPPKDKHLQGKSKKTTNKKQSKISTLNQCRFCEKILDENQRVLFVEEEVGRVFCAEECILSYFNPEIDLLETRLQTHRKSEDFSDMEREELVHLKWSTLEQPDEVWCEKTLAGDYRYTLITVYDLEGEQIWSVAVTLFLNAEPSFLFLSFPTRDRSLVEVFKKGEPIEIQKFRSERDESQTTKIITSEGIKDNVSFDGLAEPWTLDETITAELRKKRRREDIPVADYGLYEDCVEDTLQNPDEVWLNQKLYHFIKKFEEAKDATFWYVVAAKETNEDDQLEIIDQFPTQDLALIEAYRTGSCEVVSNEDQTLEDASSESSTPIIH